MTNYNFADVVLVSFPFTDQNTTKQRPAVIVSSAAYHNAYNDVILMAISSQARLLDVGDVEIIHWRRAGLIKPSTIRPYFTTIDRGLIIRKFGQLDPEDERNLRAAIPTIIG